MPHAVRPIAVVERENVVREFAVAAAAASSAAKKGSADNW